MVYIPRYSRHRRKEHKHKEIHEVSRFMWSYSRFLWDMRLIIGDDDIFNYQRLMMMLRSDQAEEWDYDQAKEKVKEFKELLKDCKGAKDSLEVLEKHYPGAAKKYFRDKDYLSKI